METFIVRLVVNALLALLGGWSLMIAVGVAHAKWLTTMPTCGYWTAVLIVWLLRGTFVVVTADDMKTKR